ncbi:MAG: hypothetical protein GXP27_06280, partial [Planctomycetes bacterium]|nr:hypothetical protein [Planctomycetota bacterium]
MADGGERQLRWYQGLTRYHWLVLIIGVLSWTFDCMDQRLFVLSRQPAIKDLTGWPQREAQLRPDIEAAVTEEVRAAVQAGEVEAAAQEEEVEQRVRERLNAVYEEELRNKVDSLGDIVTAL